MCVVYVCICIMYSMLYIVYSVYGVYNKYYWPLKCLLTFPSIHLKGEIINLDKCEIIIKKMAS